MPSDFCGYLSDSSARLKNWQAALSARQFGMVRWAGSGGGNGTQAAAFVSAQGQATQLYNDGAALAVLAGAPYLLEDHETAAYNPLTLAAIVAMFAADGAAALARIGGTFALVVSFPQRRELFLAIDRFAVENLFYVAHGGDIAYATRALNLASHPAVNLRFSAQAAYDYLYFHCIPGPETGFNGMARLLPGQYLHSHDGRSTVRTYWEPAYSEDRQTPMANLVAELPA